MPQGIVVMREWEDLGCVAYQSHVQQKVMKFDLLQFVYMYVIWSIPLFFVRSFQWYQSTMR